MAFVSDPATRDVLAVFEEVRDRLFERLEGLTDAEYLWEPAGDGLSIRPGVDGVFRVDEWHPEPVPGAPDPVTSGRAARKAAVRSACCAAFTCATAADPGGG